VRLEFAERRMKTRFSDEKVAEIEFPGWNGRHEVKNRPRGAGKAEGMAAIFNTLVKPDPFGSYPAARPTHPAAHADEATGFLTVM